MKFFMICMLFFPYASISADETNYVAICIERGGRILLLKSCGPSAACEYSLPRARGTKDGQPKVVMRKMLSGHGIRGKIVKSVPFKLDENPNRGNSKFYAVVLENFDWEHQILATFEQSLQLLRDDPDEDFKLFFQHVLQRPWVFHLVIQNDIMVPAYDTTYIYVCVNENKDVMLLRNKNAVASSSGSTAVEYFFPETRSVYKDRDERWTKKFLKIYGVKGRVRKCLLYSSTEDRRRVNRSRFFLVHLQFLSYYKGPCDRLFVPLRVAAEFLRNHPNGDYELFMNCVLRENPSKFSDHFDKIQDSPADLPVIVNKVTLFCLDAMGRLLFVRKSNGRYGLPQEIAVGRGQPDRGMMLKHAMCKYGIVGCIYKRTTFVSNNVSDALHHVFFLDQKERGLVNLPGRVNDIRYDVDFRVQLFPKKARCFLQDTPYLSFLNEIYAGTDEWSKEFAVGHLHYLRIASKDKIHLEGKVCVEKDGKFQQIQSPQEDSDEESVNRRCPLMLIM